MEFAIEKSKLVDFINVCPIDKKSIVKDVLIFCDASNDKVHLKSIAYDTIFNGSIDAKVQESGECAVDGNLLQSIIKALPNEEVRIKYENEGDKEIKINSGKSKFKLLVNKENIDLIKSADSSIVFDEFFEIDNYMLLDMINSTEFSMSFDAARRNINGIFFKIQIIENDLFITMVSTDGHRLSKVENKIKNGCISTNCSCILPNSIIGVLKRFIKESDKIKVSFANHRVIFDNGNSSLLARTSEETYPDYTKIIPGDGDSWIKIHTSNILDSIKRVTLFNNEKRKGIAFNAKKDFFSIESKNIDTGEAREEIGEIETSENFVDFSVGFNYKYILDVFNAVSLTDESFVWFQTGTDSAAKIYPFESKNKMFILMPIRL